MPKLSVIIQMIMIILLSKEGVAAMKLDSSRYFQEPRAVEFVDSVQIGEVNRLKQMINTGMDVNLKGTQGFRPIHFAFFPKNSDVLKVLLAAGADPNARLSNGNSPLHFAVRMSNADFTRVLLASGADANARGENEKPAIHEALTSLQPENLKLLVAAGANVNVLWGGTTPLLAAMKMFLWEMATTLVDLNGDVNFRDNTRKNAAERFCFQINKVPPTSKNRKEIPLLADALKRRGSAVPCEAQLARFR